MAKFAKYAQYKVGTPWCVLSRGAVVQTSVTMSLYLFFLPPYRPNSRLPPYHFRTFQWVDSMYLTGTLQCYSALLHVITLCVCSGYVFYWYSIMNYVLSWAWYKFKFEWLKGKWYTKYSKNGLSLSIMLFDAWTRNEVCWLRQMVYQSCTGVFLNVAVWRSSLVVGMRWWGLRTGGWFKEFIWKCWRNSWSRRAESGKVLRLNSYH